MKVIFPESDDERVVEAIEVIKQKGICEPVTLSDFDIDENILINHLYEKRKEKGMTREEAKEKMKDRLYKSATLVSLGYADAGIAGSLSPTKDVLRAGLQVIELEQNVKTVSSFFLMKKENNIYAFSDCAVVEDPTSEQLCDIAISTSDNYFKLTNQKPIVALLSYSTLGSAESEMVKKVRNALSLVKEKRPDIVIDGEMQFDAAFIESVGKSKAPHSEVSGHTNVFIFPDLNSGNIGYKIAERMGGYQAIGPIIQGLSKPFMDLSRGCTSQDIINLTVILSKL